MCQINNQIVDSSLLDSFGLEKTLKNKTQDVFYNGADPVPFVSCSGLPQKKGLSLVIKKNKIKDVESVFCVSQCVSVPHAQSAQCCRNSGCRGQSTKILEEMVKPRGKSILKEGYTLPFKMRPPLTRSPVVRSGYANPVRNRHLKKALLALIQKLVVEKVVVRSSLAFYNRLFLVPKPNNKWRPILDVCQLNLFLRPELSRWRLQKQFSCPYKKGSG